MAVKDDSDPLTQLLGTWTNNRQVIWLWLGLCVHEKFDLDGNSCGGATMRDVVAQALMAAPDITSNIPAIRDRYLLPEEQLAWMTSSQRQLQWLTPRIDELTDRILPSGLVHLQGRDRLVATLDIWQVDLEKKQREVERLHNRWRRHIAMDSQLEWFNDKKEGSKRCVCAWEWLQKKYLSPFSRQIPISNHQELLMFFDQEDIPPNERIAIIKTIRQLWSKKQFNERSIDKKQVNVMLSTTVIAQLDTLAKVHGLKRAQIIENLVRMEADAGVYLADD